MSTGDRRIHCEVHGDQQATFVCQHIVRSLREDRPYGFFWAEDPESARPDAWCTACNEQVASTGGDWTEESEAFAGVTLICGACYDRAKAMNLQA
jgi:hypothetical protein